MQDKRGNHWERGRQHISHMAREARAANRAELDTRERPEQHQRPRREQQLATFPPGRVLGSRRCCCCCCCCCCLGTSTWELDVFGRFCMHCYIVGALMETRGRLVAEGRQHFSIWYRKKHYPKRVPFSSSFSPKKKRGARFLKGARYTWYSSGLAGNLRIVESSNLYVNGPNVFVGVIHVAGAHLRGKSSARGGGGYSYDTCLDPFRTSVPFWGQIT